LIRSEEPIMTVSERLAADQSVAFRRRLNTFFGDPRTPELAARLDPPSPRPPATAAAALGARLGDVLTRLGTATPIDRFRLRKSMTMHDGKVVAMTGDPSPVGSNEDVRVVTTTTTVLDGARLRSETTILVFERGGGLPLPPSEPGAES
jgi:hypothetical protein